MTAHAQALLAIAHDFDERMRALPGQGPGLALPLNVRPAFLALPRAGSRLAAASWP
jgi:hypothetical protein